MSEGSGAEQVSEGGPSKIQETPSEPPATDRATPPSSQDAREPSAHPVPTDAVKDTAAGAARKDTDADDLPSIEAITTTVTHARAEIEPTPAPDAETIVEPSESTPAAVAILEPSEDATPSNAEPSSAASATAKAKPRAKRPAAPRKKKSPDAATEETAAAKRPTRKRTRQTTEVTEDDEEATEEPVARPRKRRARTASGEANGEARTTPTTRARRARSVTPEDAESQTVDLQQMKMSDLTRDLRIGKKFSRHDELRERERQKKIKAKLQKEGVEVEDDEENRDQTPNGEKKGRDGEESNSNNGPSASGPQFRIVDGQIVLDQTSLVMDRHARAAAEQEDMELIEENDFSRQITSNSYMSSSKLRKGNNWSAEDTELFYRGLGMFGTDFEMISKMFKNKVRREVKLKFNREERNNPKLIDAALIGEKSVKMDIDEYKKLTSSEFESVESIEAEQQKIADEYEAERQRIADAQAEDMRKKREALFADDKDGQDGEGGKKKKKKSKKQRLQEAGLYGDEEIALD